MIAVVIFVYALAVGAFLFVLLRGSIGPVLVQRWATVNAVDIAASSDPAVVTYLRNNRDLRRLGFVGGCLVPPAVKAAVGIEAPISASVWPFLGYLVGCLWAEATVTRVPGAGPRTALLDTRRLRDYLPRPLLVAQAVVPVLALAGAVAILLVTESPRTVPLTNQRSLAVAAIPLIALLTPMVWWAQRRIVGRPQPLTGSDQLGVDDAMRATSVRLVGATFVLIGGSMLAEQIEYIALRRYDSSALGMLGMFIAVGAFFAWLWWVNRGWRPRRASATGPLNAVGA